MTDGEPQGRQGSPGPYGGLQRERGLAREGLTHDLGTTAGRIAENRARVERNEDRERRRRAGEEDVEEDEQILELMSEDGTSAKVQNARSRSRAIPSAIFSLELVVRL